MTRQVLVDAEALEKVLMLLPHDAISHLPDEARAAQSLRNALTQPQPSSSAGEMVERVTRGLESAHTRYYYELDKIARDDSRKDELPEARARYRAISDLWDEFYPDLRRWQREQDEVLATVAPA